MKEDKGQILLYQTPDGESRIEVTLQGETVWLSLDQMAELFQRNKSTISRHIKNVFEEGELNKDMVVAKFATTTQHGAIEGRRVVRPLWCPVGRQTLPCSCRPNKNMVMKIITTG